MVLGKSSGKETNIKAKLSYSDSELIATQISEIN